MVKVCDGCRFLNPQESHPDTEVHFCQLRGHRVYHHGHHPNIPRPDFCPISDELARIAALEAERDRLRGSRVEIATWCGRPLNIKCNECGPGYWPHCHELVMIARKAMEE